MKNGLRFFQKKKGSEVFFVRGFQRSGTNWVCNLLNLHPDINCVGEFHFKELFQAKNRMLRRNHGLLKRKPEDLSQKVDDLIKGTIIEYCGHARFCGDRTPESLHDTTLKGCKYILIHRDPRDILVSWIYHLYRYDHDFGAAMNKKKEIFKRDPDYFEKNKQDLFNVHWVRKIAKDWNKRVNLDMNALNKQDELGIECLFIQYESLIESTEEYRTRMYNFLNCSPLSAANLTEKTKPGFARHDPNSHYRFGAVGRWKHYFSDENLSVFEHFAKKGLKRLGYSTYTL